ncbi:ISL3 family transposase [Azospirillum isscasi]|uniref:ISL3 family transposase n=1 Tax=Azospirillum isscasi TaxID=3053926 RepID=A0ABU0WDD0_9PROT|nr:ISL3 family transposase [Azospirillum isscasi]MDQ2102194.1 ISL3 family transposase [Azospirillum isscasi]
MPAPLSKFLLSLLPAGLAVDQVSTEADRVAVTAHMRAAKASCPLCRRPSVRVHSRYMRHLGDLPWQGRIGELRLLVRRFRCATADCSRRIFAERLPTVAAPRVRRTRRLAEAQRTIALSAGGDSGARLSTRLAMPVSGDTLLRLIRAEPVPPVCEARITGIDDWAWRRGKRYGTIVVDLERNRPIDLLPDRQADTVATWLKARPGVEIVARDRAGAYADGVRQGAPAAVQVADRWHLLHNLTDALREVLTGHHRDLRAAARLAVSPVGEAGPVGETGQEPRSPRSDEESSPPTRREQRSAAIHAARHARYEEVVALKARGWSQTRIAETLHLDRKTVRVWLRSGQPPAWRQPAKGSRLDPFLDHLRQRWDGGCHNAAQLWREIRSRGFTGQRSIVRDWARLLRQTVRSAASMASTSWPVPSRRRAAWLVIADEQEIDPTEQAFVSALIARSPELGRTITVTRAFRAMVRGQRAGELDNWLLTAEGTPLAGFANGLKRDLAAVRAALSLPWSTGPVEGQISRLKTIKRMMNGRGGFDLLRHRVLEAA